MRKAIRKNFWLAAIAATFVFSGAALAQEVKDLTNSDPSAEQLIEVLKPKTDSDDLGVARGIGVAPRKAKCSLKQRPAGTRGIGLKPISDVAAIHVLFAYNSAEILPAAGRALEALGKALASNELASSCFQIKGHTDAIGSDTYNDRLSRQRAESVAHYLTTHFNIEPDRLDAIGLGKHQPIASNSTDEGRSRNRRVEIVNVGS